LICLPIYGLAQEHVCGSDILLQNKIDNDTAIQSIIDSKNSRIRYELSMLNPKKKGKVTQQLKSGSTGANFVIPVVVYIVHKGTAIGVDANITESRVTAQIDQLNSDFSNYGFQFCLARKQGANSLPGTGINPGIIRVNDTALSDHDMLNEETALKATSTLPNSKYLRIWVVNDIIGPSGQGVGGYGTFPGVGLPANDGIVMEYTLFGDHNSIVYAGATQGKVLTHEVGHWLDLYHTFQGGCPGTSSLPCDMQGDLCCDTPPVASPNSGCPSIGSINSCSGSSTDLTDNHMDYTYSDCHYNFTVNQESRMLAATSALRSILVSSSNLAYTDVGCTNGVIAAFYADNYNPCFGNSVTFTATSVPGATYSWDFGDGSGTILTGNPVSYTYSTSNSAFTVTLTVTSGTTVLSETEEVYVSTCTPIANEQGNWVFGYGMEINFSSGSPTPIGTAALASTPIQTLESAVSVSDQSGNLLFYTDGNTLWNNSYVVTATNLNPLPASPNSITSVNQIAYCPDPGNSNQFYVFVPPSSEDYFYNNADFRYFVVDAAGNLVSGPFLLTIPFGYGYSEAIGVVPHCNGEDFWVILHSDYTAATPRFFSYLVTSNGITNGNQTTPYSTVFSPDPATIPDISIPFTKAARDAGTNIEINRKGNKISLGGLWGQATIYDFDKSNGQVLNEVNTSSSHWFTTQTCFSPSGEYLYSTGTTNNYISKISKLKLDGTLIQEMAIYGRPWSIQLGPDNKIYLSGRGDNYNGNDFISCIPNPNEINSNFILEAVSFSQINANNSLNINSSILSSIPNMIDALPPSQVAMDFDYTITNCDEVSFDAVQCSPSYSWDFDDPNSGSDNTSSLENPTHIFSSSGTYNVVLTGAGQTIVKNILIDSLNFDIVGNTEVCTLCYGTLENYSTEINNNWIYDWTVTGGSILGFSNTHNIDVDWTNLPGTVELQVTDENGCTNTEIISVLEQSNCDPKIVIDNYYVRKFSSENDHNHYSIETIDEDAIVVGTIFPIGSTDDTDVHVQRLDNDGLVLWEYFYDLDGDERSFTQIVHNDRIVIAGLRRLNGGLWNTFILVLDANDGSIINNMMLEPVGTTTVNKPLDILYSGVSGGRYYIASRSFGVASILCLDLQLNFLWSRKINNTFTATAINEIDGQGVLLTSMYGINNGSLRGSSDILFDYSGTVLWQNNMSSPKDNFGTNAIYDAPNDRLIKIGGIGGRMITMTTFDDVSFGPPFLTKHQQINILATQDMLDDGFTAVYTKNIEINSTSDRIGIFGHSYGDIGYRSLFPYMIILDRNNLKILESHYTEVYNGSTWYDTHDWGLHYRHGIHSNPNGFTTWEEGFGFITYSNDKELPSENKINYSVHKVNLSGFTDSGCEIEFATDEVSLKLTKLGALTTTSQGFMSTPFVVTKNSIIHCIEAGCYELDKCVDCIYYSRSKFPKDEELVNRIEERNLTIYPNPTKHQLTIDFGQKLEVNMRLILMSIEGKIVWDENINGVEYHLLDVSTLPKGIYFIQIRGSEEEHLEKIIVQ